MRIPAWFFLGLLVPVPARRGELRLFGAKANGGGVAFFAHVGGFLFGVIVTRYSRAPAASSRAVRTPAPGLTPWRLAPDARVAREAAARSSSPRGRSSFRRSSRSAPSFSSRSPTRPAGSCSSSSSRSCSRWRSSPSSSCFERRGLARGMAVGSLRARRARGRGLRLPADPAARRRGEELRATRRALLQTLTQGQAASAFSRRASTLSSALARRSRSTAGRDCSRGPRSARQASVGDRRRDRRAVAFLTLFVTLGGRAVVRGVPPLAPGRKPRALAAVRQRHRELRRRLRRREPADQRHRRLGHDALLLATHVPYPVPLGLSSRCST